MTKLPILEHFLSVAGKSRAKTQVIFQAKIQAKKNYIELGPCAVHPISSLAPRRLVVLPDEAEHGGLAGVELPGRLFVYLAGLVVLLHEFEMISGIFDLFCTPGLF